MMNGHRTTGTADLLCERIPATRRFCPRRGSGWRSGVRRGAVAVEMAIIAPVFFLFLIGIIVTSVGVFRSAQVASLSHEAARWASVHGPRFASEQGGHPATSEDVYANVICNKVAGLDTNKLTCQVEWDDNFKTVRVTVQYRWLPEAFLGQMTLSNTAMSLVTY